MIKIKGESYVEFVEKFKPKKTTDDCYTPPNIYNAVADWVAREYSIDKSLFVRPFYPGGDYESFDYSGEKIVVDNPPFSIFSKIIQFYIKNNVKFFLFAPALTLFSSVASKQCCCLAVGATVGYENGAKVNTSFVTNLELEDIRIRTAPELYQIIKKANDSNQKAQHKQLPKYDYPPYVVTAAKMNAYSSAGIELVIPQSESLRISALDSQKQKKKRIFGNGYIVSERCKSTIEKAEREKAEQAKRIEWALSDREYQIIKSLSSY